MSMQQIMRWGHDFLRIRGWRNIHTFGTMGKSQRSKGEPIKTINYLSCLIHPIIYYFLKLVELVIAWDGQGMEAKNLNWRSHKFLGNMILTYGGSYCPKLLPIPSCIHIFCLPHAFGAPGHSHSRFLQFPVFFPHGWEVVLLTFSGWDLRWVFLWLFSSFPH